MPVEHRRYLVAAIGCWMLWLGQVAWSDEPSLRRWAILASPEVRETGVSDLLSAELTARSIEQVERDQLAVITKEIELSTLFGAKDGAARLKIGQLVKADALVVLTIVEQNKQRLLRAVLCDCQYGARLKLEHRVFSQSGVEKLAGELATLVTETRTKYARGIEQVVAVSPFLSKNISREFEHLQFGFAAWLGHALSQQPGVAVLEIEEAHALSDETRISGSELKRRPVPVFVEGEYEVRPRPEAAGKANNPRELKADDELRGQQIKLVVRRRDGKSERAPLEHTFDGIPDTVRWLSSVVEEHLSLPPRKDARETSLSTEQQVERLEHRAQQFASWSAFEEATALREAALLYEPTNWELRGRLIQDYRDWGKLRTFELATVTVKISDQRRAKLIAERLKYGVIAARHVEYLLETVPMSPIEIDNVIGRHLFDLQMKTIEIGPDGGRLGDVREFFWRWTSRLRTADPTIRQGVVHQLLKEHPTNQDIARSPQSQIDKCATNAVNRVSMKLQHITAPAGALAAQNNDRKQLLADIPRVFRVVLGKDRFSHQVLNQLHRAAQGDLPYLVSTSRLTAEELEGIYQELIQSDDPVLQFYGYYGRLAQRHLGLGTRKLQPDDFVEFEKFFATFHQKMQVARLSINMTHHVADRFKQADVPNQGSRWKEPTSELPARLAFEPLADTATSAMFVQKCDQQLDLHLSKDEVAVMTKRGELRRLLRVASKSDVVWHAIWDGQSIWVATLEGGLFIFDLNGKQIGHLKPGDKSDSGGGIPEMIRGAAERTDVPFAMIPYRRPLLLHPLAPGRVLVTGEVGADHRRWFGVVSRGTDKQVPWKFEMWHEASRTLDNKVADNPVDSKFEPTFLITYRPPQGLPVVLAGRPFTVLTREVGKTPLAFDPVTGKARTLPGLSIMDLDWRLRDVLQIGPDLIVANDGITRCIPPKNGIDGAWTQQALVSSWDRKHFSTEYGQQWRNQLLYDGQHLFRPGTYWWRVETKTWQIEKLNEKPLPAEMRFKNYAVSAHYGLVAWNSGKDLHLVHVDSDITNQQRDKWATELRDAATRTKKTAR